MAAADPAAAAAAVAAAADLPAIDASAPALGRVAVVGRVSKPITPAARINKQADG